MRTLTRYAITNFIVAALLAALSTAAIGAVPGRPSPFPSPTGPALPANPGGETVQPGESNTLLSGMNRLAAPHLNLGNDVTDCTFHVSSNPDVCIQDFANGDLGVLVSWSACSAADCAPSAGAYAIYRVPAETRIMTVAKTLPPISPPLPSDHQLVASGTIRSIGFSVISRGHFAIGDCFVVRVFAGDRPIGLHSTDSAVGCVTTATPIGTKQTALDPYEAKGGNSLVYCTNPPNGPWDNKSQAVGYFIYAANALCPWQGTDWTKTWSIEEWVYVDFRIAPNTYITGGSFVMSGDTSCASELDVVSPVWMNGDPNPPQGGYVTFNGLHYATISLNVDSWVKGLQANSQQGYDFTLRIKPSPTVPSSACISQPGAMALNLTVLK